MYKKLLIALLAMSTFAVLSSADFARVEAGAGVWNQEPTVALNNGISSVEDKENDIYVWAYVKHFVPVIPNFRFEHVTATADNLEFSQTDIIPYYNILDNTAWITIDLGIDFKMIDLTLESPMGSISTSDADSMVLPLGYVRTRIQLPFSGFGAEADVKYVSYSDNTVYDARLKVDYTFDITPLVQPGIEIGYRVQKIETDELLPISINSEFSGIYAGAILRF